MGSNPVRNLDKEYTMGRDVTRVPPKEDNQSDKHCYRPRNVGDCWASRRRQLSRGANCAL